MKDTRVSPERFQGWRFALSWETPSSWRYSQRFTVNLLSLVFVNYLIRNGMSNSSSLSCHKVHNILDGDVSVFLFDDTVNNITPLQCNFKKKPVDYLLKVIWVVQFYWHDQFPSTNWRSWRAGWKTAQTRIPQLVVSHVRQRSCSSDPTFPLTAFLFQRSLLLLAWKGNSSLVPKRDQKYSAPGNVGVSLNLRSSVPRGFRTRVRNVNNR